MSKNTDSEEVISICHDESGDQFSQLLVPDLQKYLRDRGVVYSGYKKNELVELCQEAKHLDLPTDPDFFGVNQREEMLGKLLVNGGTITNPEILKGSLDLSSLPLLNQFDLYQYLVENKGARSHAQVKAFKNLIGYQMYAAGMDAVDSKYFLHILIFVFFSTRLDHIFH